MTPTIRKQITALRAEALALSPPDHLQVAMCDIALTGITPEGRTLFAGVTPEEAEHNCLNAIATNAAAHPLAAPNQQSILLYNLRQAGRHLQEADYLTGPRRGQQLATGRR